MPVRHQQRSFSVGATDSNASKSYRNNYDAIFGKKDAPVNVEEPAAEPAAETAEPTDAVAIPANATE